MKKLTFCFILECIVILSSCAPQYISRSSGKDSLYFNYDDIKNKYGIRVTPLSTFESIKYNTIGDLRITLHPSFLNKSDYSDLTSDEKERYINFQGADYTPLYIEQIEYVDCLKEFLNTAKAKGADGVLEFKIYSETSNYNIKTKNSLIGLNKEAMNYSCSGILVKFIE